MRPAVRRGGIALSAVTELVPSVLGESTDIAADAGAVEVGVSVGPADAMAFPVVADPTIGFGWPINVRYSESDVRTATTGLSGAIYDKAKCGFILCGRSPHRAARAGCALLGTSLHRSFSTTFTYATDHHQCGDAQLAYISYLPVVWKSYSC